MAIDDQSSYAEKVLALYLALPHTPIRFSAADRLLARGLEQQRVPLEIVEAAFLLASVRRLFRDPTLPPLSPIRSLRYFLPVIDEVSASPPSPDYLRYLRRRLDSFLNQSTASS